MKPDFICVGPAKSGTTWIYDMLSAAPGYWLPPVKEIGYFGGGAQPARDAALRRWRESDFIPAEDAAWAARFADGPRDDAWYRSLFEPAGDRLTGDISPAYCWLPPEGMAHVNRVASHARILLLVRDPVERAMSQIYYDIGRQLFGTYEAKLRQHLSAKVGLKRGEMLISRLGVPWADRLNNEKVIAAYEAYTGAPFDPAELRTEINALLSHPPIREHLRRIAREHVAGGSTAEAVERWREAVGERLAVAFYADLQADPRAFLLGVTEALGRPALPADESRLHSNPNPTLYLGPDVETIRAILAQHFQAELEHLARLFPGRFSR